MTEVEKAYDEHWSQCFDCRNQLYCETGYRLREAFRTEVITMDTGAPEAPEPSLSIEWTP